MPTLLKFGVLLVEPVHHLLVPAIALDLPCQSSHFLLDLFGLLVTICFRQLVDLTLHFLHLLPGNWWPRLSFVLLHIKAFAL